jgi:hypothetical protein
MDGARRAPAAGTIVSCGWAAALVVLRVAAGWAAARVVTRAVACWAAALVIVLGAAGCALDAPEAPQFETQVFFPLGVRTSTGLDLIDEGGYIEGDSVGADPLRFVIRGTLEEVQAGPLLDLDPPGTVFSFGLDGVRLVSAQPLRADILLASLCDQLGPLPHDTLNVTIAPFIMPVVTRALAPPENISWVRIGSGLVRLTLHNDLPVPLGGVAGSPVRVRLRDRRTGSAVATGEFPAPIVPGAVGVAEARLDGVELSSDLDLVLSGSSSGSGGAPVDVHADDQVRLEAAFVALVADSAYAAVPAQSFATVGTVQLAEDVEISEGLVRAGAVRFTVENPYPLAGAARVTLPSVHRAAGSGDPLVAAIELPAAGAGGPGRGEATLDLTGAVVRPAAGFGRSLEYRLQIDTQPSNGRVRLGVRALAHGAMAPGLLSFDAIRGRLDGRQFEIPPTETSVDPPDGIDSLSFVSATLVLEVTNGIAFPAEAELTVVGDSSRGGAPVSVPLRFSVEAAAGGVPRVTTITIDETNSNILDLLAARPRRMRVAGSLRVGSGEEGTIRRTDRVWGEYRLSAPLRVRIGRITHRTEPSSFAISEDNQDLIRDNVIDAAARGTVTNHFPAGLEVRLVLAGSEAGLALDPVAHPDSVLWLDPVVVAPGETDAATGRVVRSRATPVAVAIRRDQVPFFLRDRLYSQAVLVVAGEDVQRIVEVTALDFVEVTAMLDFRVRIKQ